MPIDTIDSELHDPLTAYTLRSDTPSPHEIFSRVADRRAALTGRQIDLERERTARMLAAREDTVREDQRRHEQMREDLARARAQRIWRTTPYSSDHYDSETLRSEDAEDSLWYSQLLRTRRRERETDLEWVQQAMPTSPSFDEQFANRHGNPLYPTALRVAEIEDQLRTLRSRSRLPRTFGTGTLSSGAGGILPHLEINDAMSSTQIASTVKMIGKIVARMPSGQRKLMAAKVVEEGVWDEIPGSEGGAPDGEEAITPRNSRPVVKRNWDGMDRDESCCVCHDDVSCHLLLEVSRVELMVLASFVVHRKIPDLNHTLQTHVSPRLSNGECPTNGRLEIRVQWTGLKADCQLLDMAQYTQHFILSDV